MWKSTRQKNYDSLCQLEQKYYTHFKRLQWSPVRWPWAPALETQGLGCNTASAHGLSPPLPSPLWVGLVTRCPGHLKCAISPVFKPRQLSSPSSPLAERLCPSWSAVSAFQRLLLWYISLPGLGYSFQEVFSAFLSPLFSNAFDISFFSFLVSYL